MNHAGTVGHRWFRSCWNAHVSCRFTNPDAKVVAENDPFEPLHYVANEHHYDSIHGRSDGSIAVHEEVLMAILCLTFHGRGPSFLKGCGLTSLSVPFLKNNFTNQCVFTFHFNLLALRFPSVSVIFGVSVFQPSVELEVAPCSVFLRRRSRAEPETALLRRVRSMDRTICPSRRIVYAVPISIINHGHRATFVSLCQ